MPTCYQLVGVPASGKSTWISTQTLLKDYVIISTDNHIEEYARVEDKTYSQVFNEFMPTAIKLMAQDVVLARKAGKDIIWDQTSISISSRRKKFNLLPNYNHIAVVFATPPIDESNRRLAQRPNKHIPAHVMTSMILNFQIPTLAEGFLCIQHIS